MCTVTESIGLEKLEADGSCVFCHKEIGLNENQERAIRFARGHKIENSLNRKKKARLQGNKRRMGR